MSDSAASTRDLSARDLPATTLELESFDREDTGAQVDGRRSSSPTARIDLEISQRTTSLDVAGDYDPGSTATDGEVSPSAFAPGAYGVAPGSGAVRLAKQLRQERRLADERNQSTMDHHQGELSTHTGASFSSTHELPRPSLQLHSIPTTQENLTSPTVVDESALTTMDVSASVAYYQPEAVLAPPCPTSALASSAEYAVRVLPYCQPAEPVTETARIDPHKGGTKAPIYVALSFVLLLLAGIGVGVGVGIGNRDVNIGGPDQSATSPSPATASVGDRSRGGRIGDRARGGGNSLGAQLKTPSSGDDVDGF
jgi:hypothetical protein